MKYSLILCGVSIFIMRNSNSGGLRGGGGVAEWGKARNPLPFKSPKSQNNVFLTLFLIRDRAPF